MCVLMLLFIPKDFYLLMPGYFFMQNQNSSLCFFWPYVCTVFCLVIFTFTLEFLAWFSVGSLLEYSLLTLFISQVIRELLGKLTSQLKKLVRLMLIIMFMPTSLSARRVIMSSLDKYVTYFFTHGSHKEFFFSVAGYKGVYSDSGVWDTFLLTSFDKLYRAVFVYTILPLSENNIIEKMSTKVSTELTQNRLFSVLKKNLTIGHILYNIVASLGFIFLTVIYVLGSTL